MGAAASIQLDYVGEITYLACAVYVLCLGGILLACRSLLSERRNSTSKQSHDVTKCQQKAEHNLQDKSNGIMGWLLSKFKGNKSKSVDLTEPKARDRKRRKSGSPTTDKDLVAGEDENEADTVAQGIKSVGKNKRNSKQGSSDCETSHTTRRNSNKKTNKEARRASSQSSDYTKRKTSEEKSSMTRSFSSDVVCQDSHKQELRREDLKATKAISEGNLPTLVESKLFSREIFDSLGDYFGDKPAAVEPDSSVVATVPEMVCQDAAQTNSKALIELPTTHSAKASAGASASGHDKIKDEIVQNELSLSAASAESPVASSNANAQEPIIAKPSDVDRSDALEPCQDRPREPLRLSPHINSFANDLCRKIMISLASDIQCEMDRMETAKDNRLRFAKDLANTVLDNSFFVAPSNNDASERRAVNHVEYDYDPMPPTTDEEREHPHCDATVAGRLRTELHEHTPLGNYVKKVTSDVWQSALTDLSNGFKHDKRYPNGMPEDDNASRSKAGAFVHHQLAEGLDTDSESDDEVVMGDVQLRQSQRSTLERRPLSSYAEKLVDFLDDDDDELSDLSSEDDDNESDLDTDNVLHSAAANLKVDIAAAAQRGGIAVKRRNGVPLTVVTEHAHTDEISCSDSEYSTSLSQGLMTPVTPLSPPVMPEWKNNSPRRSFSDSSSRGKYHSGSTSDSISSLPCLKKTLVLDFGCSEIRAGLAGERQPECIFPSLTGVPRRFSQHIGGDVKPSYFGHNAVASAARLQLDHPLKVDGMTDWSNIFYLLEYTLEELDVIASERPLLISSIAEGDSAQKEKLAEIVFERLNCPGLYIANQGALTMMSMGLKSGLCLNSGFSATQCIPVYDGSALPFDMQTLDIGGDEITTHLGRLIMANGGQVFSSSSEKLILEDIKKNCAYISMDRGAEVSKLADASNSTVSYTLPDGQDLEIGAERFECSEILFNPNEIGLTQLSLPQLITSSIVRADKEDRMEMVRNIVISGGTSRLHGFIPRLSQELDKSSFLKGQHRLLVPSDPQLAAWTGGSIMTSLSTFENQYMTIDDYEDLGARHIHRYCF